MTDDKDDAGGTALADCLDRAYSVKMLLSVSEAARVLGMDPKTLRICVAVGQIRHVTIGLGTQRPRRRFARSHLLEFIERSSVGGELYDVRGFKAFTRSRRSQD